jgi:hypothetical protein
MYTVFVCTRTPAIMEVIFTLQQHPTFKRLTMGTFWTLGFPTSIQLMFSMSTFSHSTFSRSPLGISTFSRRINAWFSAKLSSLLAARLPSFDLRKSQECISTFNACVGQEEDAASWRILSSLQDHAEQRLADPTTYIGKHRPWIKSFFQFPTSKIRWTYESGNIYL